MRLWVSAETIIFPYQKNGDAEKVRFCFSFGKFVRDRNGCVFSISFAKYGKSRQLDCPS